MASHQILISFFYDQTQLLSTFGSIEGERERERHTRKPIATYIDKGNTNHYKEQTTLHTHTHTTPYHTSPTLSTPYLNQRTKGRTGRTRHPFHFQFSFSPTSTPKLQEHVQLPDIHSRVPGDSSPTDIQPPLPEASHMSCHLQVR